MKTGCSFSSSCHGSHRTAGGHLLCQFFSIEGSAGPLRLQQKAGMHAVAREFHTTLDGRARAERGRQAREQAGYDTGRAINGNQGDVAKVKKTSNRREPPATSSSDQAPWSGCCRTLELAIGAVTKSRLSPEARRAIGRR